MRLLFCKKAEDEKRAKLIQGQKKKPSGNYDVVQTSAGYEIGAERK
jgi:hypothetical protein